MKVILKRDVKGLGREGDLREVKDGYARNLLLPSGAAVQADVGAIRNWERHREQREERERMAHADAEALVARLSEVHLHTELKAGEHSRLFGSVTNREIAELLHQQGIDIDRHAIHLREPIKTLGEHRATVHLGAGLDATLVVEVAALVEGQTVTTA